MEDLLDTRKIQKPEEVFIFAYVAGHGVTGAFQNFMLNEPDIKDVCYEIEKALRSYSEAAVNKACKVFAVYDICREDIG